jgi:hypothetical protein
MIHFIKTLPLKSKMIVEFTQNVIASLRRRRGNPVFCGGISGLLRCARNDEHFA